jgi:hypothetical protein
MKALLLTCLLLTAAPSFAQNLYGLGTIVGFNILNRPVNSQGIVTISPVTGAAINLNQTPLSGIEPTQLLVGIDFRPADNQLYALGYNAATTAANTQLYTVDLNANSVTKVGAAIRLELGTTTDRIGFDFDPVADRIRVTSTNRANYLLNPTDGSLVATDGNLTYADGSLAAPQVSAVAYSNSYAGSTATTLYALDYRNSLLSMQSLSGTGSLTNPLAATLTVASGTYSLGQPDAIGLDVYYDPITKQDIGYLTEVTDLRVNGTRASNTYRLNLTTGAATLLGNTVPASTLLNFEIRDVAVSLPVVPLPVKLVSFTAAAVTPATVRLAWTTASEQHNAYFAVERSADGQLFTTLGTVPGAGTSTQQHTYAYLDAQSLPLGYYRLRQVDDDGSTHFSPVVAVQAKAEALTFAPNPVVGQAVFSSPAPTTLTVRDELGRVCQQLRLAAGSQQVSFEALPAGVYLLTDETTHRTTRLLKAAP